MKRNPCPVVNVFINRETVFISIAIYILIVKINGDICQGSAADLSALCNTICHGFPAWFVRFWSKIFRVLNQDLSEECSTIRQGSSTRFVRVLQYDLTGFCNIISQGSESRFVRVLQYYLSVVCSKICQGSSIRFYRGLYQNLSLVCR